MEMARTLWTLYQPNIRKNNHRNSTWTTWPSTSKLSQLMVLWVGASLVLDGQLTLGQLIAFESLVDMSHNPSTTFNDLATHPRTTGEF